MVVHNVRKVVCGQRIGRFVENLVVESGGVYCDVAADNVVHLHILVLGHLEADDPLLAGVYTAPHLIIGQRERIAEAAAAAGIVRECLAARLALGAQVGESLGSVEGIISIAAFDELHRVFEVDSAPLALAVGGVRAAHAYSFVHLNAAPLERLYYVVFRAGHKPLAVGILYAEDEITAVFACEKVVVKGCAYAADMQCASGAGGKADSDFFHIWTIKKPPLYGQLGVLVVDRRIELLFRD